MAANRVVWLLAHDAVEEGGDEHLYETRGWLDDSVMLRWSLVSAIRVEGTHDGMSYMDLTEIVEGVEFEWSTDDRMNKVTVARVPVRTT